MPKRKAIKLALQLPDPGIGMATKRIKKSPPYLSNFSLCLALVFSKTLPITRSQKGETLLKKVVIGSKISSKMKFGAMLPKVAQKKASAGGSFRAPIAKGMAPLSSVIGSIAAIKVKA